MNSCLYECHVMHARFSPRAHSFLYRIFLFAIDLDELPTLPRRLLPFSLEKFNAYSFRDADFFPTTGLAHRGADTPPSSSPSVRTASQTPAPIDLKARVTAYASAHGVDVAGGRIVLVTLPRVVGYLFNPVSFYFCFDRTGAPVAAIAEVTNTFREVKPFWLGPESIEKSSGGAPGSDPRSATFRLRVPKHFYVSPYSDVDVAFDFTLRLPGDRLSIQIDDFVGSERTLTSTLAGPRRELTSGRLAWFTLKYPLITVRVITLIHWHALKLWVKRVPWFAKSARAADQRDLYRPHHSLSPVSVSAPSEAA